jgi:hypothetical protein
MEAWNLDEFDISDEDFAFIFQAVESEGMHDLHFNDEGDVDWGLVAKESEKIDLPYQEFLQNLSRNEDLVEKYIPRVSYSRRTVQSLKLITGEVASPSKVELKENQAEEKEKSLVQSTVNTCEEQPTTCRTQEEDQFFELEDIVGRRKLSKRKLKALGITPTCPEDLYEYEVKWLGYGPENNSWEPYKNVAHCPENLERLYEIIEEEKQQFFELEDIVGRRKLTKREMKALDITPTCPEELYEYEVKWLGYGTECNSWVAYKNLAHCPKNLKRLREMMEEEKQEFFELEDIVGRRKLTKRKMKALDITPTCPEELYEYEIKWLGYRPEENTWVPYKNLAHCPKNLKRLREMMEEEKQASALNNSHENPTWNPRSLRSGRYCLTDLTMDQQVEQSELEEPNPKKRKADDWTHSTPPKRKLPKRKATSTRL